MSYFTIQNEDLPQGFTLRPHDKFYDSLWEMMDDGYFPSTIPLKTTINGVDMPSVGWLEVDEGLYDILIDGLDVLRPTDEEMIVSATGWPLEKNRALILNFFRNLRMDIIGTYTLQRSFITIMSIVLFGDQNPRLRRKKRSRVSLGKMLFDLALRMRSKIRRMKLTEVQVTGQNLVKDLCLLHILDLQKRLVTRGTIAEKRFFTTFEQAPCNYGPKRYGMKKKHMNFMFESDLKNLTVHPTLVNLEEHWITFESARERLLDTTFTKDWPVVGSL
uniref:Nonstructural protein n=1 Tax=Uukuniemi virus TaxID=11591 RepID=A0A097SRX0_UUK|nr:nonstructural protein [Uukuniemi virus]